MRILIKTAMGGSTAQSEGQYHNNSNYWLRFDAYEDIVIESVKVFADGADDRTIAAIDAAGNILDQVTVAVPDGESVVELGLEVPAGVSHGLRSLDGNPQLWRDGQGSDLNYPYEIGTLATITSAAAAMSTAAVTTAATTNAVLRATSHRHCVWLRW